MAVSYRKNGTQACEEGLLCSSFNLVLPLQRKIKESPEDNSRVFLCSQTLSSLVGAEAGVASHSSGVCWSKTRSAVCCPELRGHPRLPCTPGTPFLQTWYLAASSQAGVALGDSVCSTTASVEKKCMQPQWNHICRSLITTRE